MARSTGLAPRRGYTLDAATVLVGPVAAGARGRAATTRTGAEQLLNTRLEAQDVFKLVVHGNASAAGQYTIQVAHVPEGSTTPSTYGTIALVTCAPGIQEIPISGAVVREIARTAPNPDVTGDVRVVAIKAVAGADANAPAGVNTISVQYA
ncbi:MAG: hypothetical protein ACO3C6_09335 [Steroidobacteraceae bacterium]|jgi:hypothetical protein